MENNLIMSTLIMSNYVEIMSNYIEINYVEIIFV